MANPAMVRHCPRNVLRQNLHIGSTPNRFVASSETRGIALAPVKTHSSNMEGIREVILSSSFDPDTFEIVISSWRQGTTSNFYQYINKWFIFSMVSNISPAEPPTQIALDFPTSLIKKEKSCNQICTARSALASIISPQNNILFGHLHIVKRYVTGVLKRIQLSQNTISLEYVSN